MNEKNIDLSVLKQSSFTIFQWWNAIKVGLTSFARIRTSLAGISPDDGTRGCWIMAETGLKEIIIILQGPRLQLLKQNALYLWHVAS